MKTLLFLLVSATLTNGLPLGDMSTQQPLPRLNLNAGYNQVVPMNAGHFNKKRRCKPKTKSVDRVVPLPGVVTPTPRTFNFGNFLPTPPVPIDLPRVPIPSFKNVVPVITPSANPILPGRVAPIPTGTFLIQQSINIKVPIYTPTPIVLPSCVINCQWQNNLPRTVTPVPSVTTIQLLPSTTVSTSTSNTVDRVVQTTSLDKNPVVVTPSSTRSANGATVPTTTALQNCIEKGGRIICLGVQTSSTTTTSTSSTTSSSTTSTSTTSSSSPTPGTYFRILGMELAAGQLTTRDLSQPECAQACDSTPGCIGYSIDKQNGRSCSLKNALSLGASSNSRDAYLSASAQSNGFIAVTRTNFLTGTYKYLNVLPAQCRNECLSDNSCIGYSARSEALRVSGCWLKSSIDGTLVRTEDGIDTFVKVLN